MAVDWSTTLSALLAREPLDRDRARNVMSEILRGDVEPTLIAAFLTALTACGETVEELTGFVDAMMDAATTIVVPHGTMDIVGTGGDQSGSVNVSTMAALTVAACGVPVAKHGNRAASSRVGAADVLEALGVKVDAAADVVARCVADVGFGFCFAPVFHPGMRHLGPVRRQLGFPTVMNLLGPLANPGRVERLVVGAARENVMEVMAGVLVVRGVDRAAIVHSDDGLDELSLGAASTIVHVSPRGTTTTRFEPSSVGRHHASDEIAGGDVTVNADVVRRYLDAEPGAVFDVVTANAGLALVVAGHAPDVREGMARAASAVTSGSARRILAHLVAASNAR